MRASTVASARRSPNTRAVMPTLVAVSAAPKKMAALPSIPNPNAAPAPAANGSTTPTTATAIAAAPTLPSSARSISMPTDSRRSSTPISASIEIDTPRWSVRSTSPRTDGPIRMPAAISPSTPGTCTFSQSSPASLAATSTTRRSRSRRARSTETVVANMRPRSEQIAGGVLGGGTQHPTARAHRDDRVGAETATQTDEDAVTPALAQVGEARLAGEFATAEHASTMGEQRSENGPLLHTEGRRSEGVGSWT
jgi:hypothetical protein